MTNDQRQRFAVCLEPCSRETIQNMLLDILDEAPHVEEFLVSLEAKFTEIKSMVFAEMLEDFDAKPH